MNNKSTLQCLNFPKTEYAELLETSFNKSNIDNKEGFSFCYLENDTTKNRLLLRKLINNDAKGHYILVSENEKLAFLAWKANVIGFLHFKEKSVIDCSILKERLKKYPPNKAKIEEKLRINYKGGFDLVNIKNICFCVGSGNYTYIYLENGTRKCISYPLNTLEKRLVEVGFLKRIGKSFIVNLNRIKKVQTEYLVFKGTTEIELKLGTVYIKRVKQNLLWY